MGTFSLTLTACTTPCQAYLIGGMLPCLVLRELLARDSVGKQGALDLAVWEWIIDGACGGSSESVAVMLLARNLV